MHKRQSVVDEPVEYNLDDLEEDFDDDEYDDDPLELIGVRLVQLRGKDVEELLDDVEPLVEHLRAPCLLYTSPSPRDQRGSRMPSSA